MHGPPLVVELQGVPGKGVPAGSRHHSGGVQQCPAEGVGLQGAEGGKVPKKKHLQVGRLP